MRDRTLADGCPHAARDRLQTDAVFVCRKDLDLFAGMLRCLLGNGVRELFLNAAASSGVADFGFFGRGFWIDQPMAFNAYLAFAAPDNPLSRNASLCPATRLPARQPRCGATDTKPSSPAIQAATLRLDHSKPSGGGSPRRSRSFRLRVRASGLSPMRRCGAANRPARRQGTRIALSADG